MGVKELLEKLKEKYPEVYLEFVRLSVFKGCKLGVDVSIYAYKYMAVSRKEAMKYLDVSKEDPPHHILKSYWLEKYYLMMLALLECDILPVPVFDGPPFRLKEDTKDERVADYKKVEEKIKELRSNIAADPSNEKLVSVLKSTMANHVGFKNQDWVDLEEMLRVMGLPVVVAKYEAEAVCARFVRMGLTAGVITNDGDALAHMAGIMISDVKRSYKRDTPVHTCHCMIVSEVLRVLKMTQSEFVDFCMLLGTDYNYRIKNYGWVNALKQIRAHGTLENVIEQISKKIDLSASRLSDPELRAEIKGYFMNDLDCKPEHPLEVIFPLKADCELAMFLEEAIEMSSVRLKATFTRIFSGYNRDRMLESAEATIKILAGFNQRFAELQTFEVKS